MNVVQVRHTTAQHRIRTRLTAEPCVVLSTDARVAVCFSETTTTVFTSIGMASRL